jgi:hypothetical protein
MRKSILLVFFAVLWCGVIGCNISGQPCGLLNLSACSQDNGTGGDGCGGGFGFGGGGVAGGAGGTGGAGSGTGGSFSANATTTAGAGGSSGTSTSTSAGVGAGGGPGARSAMGREPMARASAGGDEDQGIRLVRRRGHRGGTGSAQQAQCPGSPGWTLPPIPASMPLPTGAVPLVTTRLRFICTAQNVGAGATGIQFSSACGLEFENWVLWTLQFKPNKTPIDSAVRQAKNKNNGGLPAAVIPDYLRTVSIEDIDSGKVFSFPNSAFGEVKAVAGSLTPGDSRWQILGLLDVARRSPITMAPVSQPPPPVLELVTTGNTLVAISTIQQANLWGVVLVQQVVYEVPAVPNDPNPDLCLGAKQVLNYGSTPNPYGPAWPCSKLTSPPPGWVTQIPGDPDPPTVDG